MGGYIECIYFDDAVLICNEDGMYNHCLPNRPLVEENELIDILYGTFFLIGARWDSMTSISDAAVEKYRKKFEMPYVFSRENGKLQIKGSLNVRTFDIWMLKDDESDEKYLFRPLSAWKGNGETPNKERYQKVYSGILVPEENKAFIPFPYLEELYAEFNIAKPSDYKGRSLSVSDIIVFSDADRKEEAYYCDNIGFVPLPEFS